MPLALRAQATTDPVLPRVMGDTTPPVSRRTLLSAKPVCRFDTTAYTDTLTLNVTVRVFADRQEEPDTAMTRLVQSLMRDFLSANAPTSSHLKPGTYFSPNGSRAFSTVLSSMDVAGPLTLIPAYPTDDSAIRSALSNAFEHSRDKVQKAMAHARIQALHLQFLARTDQLGGPALFTLRAPLVRVDHDAIAIVGPGRRVRHLDFAAFYAALPVRGVYQEILIDEDGREVLAVPPGPGVMPGSSHPAWRADSTAPAFSAVSVGGCPVSYRAVIPEDRP
jgi:hypothetical protein